MSAHDRWTIVSTAPFPPEAIRRFLPDGTEADVVVVEPRTEDGAAAAVAEADVVIGDFSFEVPITRRVIEAMTRCRAILQPSAGYQQIDHLAAAEHGIPVANCAGANDVPVAEHTVMAGIALLRELVSTDQAMRAGEWPELDRRRHEVASRTWGIVGFGRIGRQVAKRLAGWDVTILYHDAVRATAHDETELGVAYAELDELLRLADVVSLHVPLLPETRHLLDRDRLALLKPDACIVNVARGGVVDEIALVDALRAGRLRGAALDVFDQEPLPPRHPLTELDNVILSPHVAGKVVEAQVRILKKTKANLLHVLAGDPLDDVVNGQDVMGSTDADGRLAVGADTPSDDVVAMVKAWIEEHVPVAWRDAADRGGAAAIREVRSRDAYEAWYPVFGRSGLVAPTWPVEHGGLGLEPATARLCDAELSRYNLGRLNPLGLNNAAAAIIAYGTEEQQRRFLPPIVRNEEVWCQLFSEPGAGSDIASLAARAERDGDEWRVSGQKVWTTWGFAAHYGLLLARTDPDVPKRKGLTYFLLDMAQPGVDVRELRHLTGEVDFCEVFLEGARVPDAHRLGDVGDGWRVANATLSGERQMVAGAGSGGVDRIGGSGVTRLIRVARQMSAHDREGGWDDPMVRNELMKLYCEERIRSFTNQRVRAALKSGRPPGPESSIGKVHGASLNMRVQLMATGLLGAHAAAWESEHTGEVGPLAYSESLSYEVQGMLRSRANSIEGGTTEVNKNILAERVLGLPREPDPHRDVTWRDTPRS